MKLRIELVFYCDPPLHPTLVGERTITLHNSTDPADQEQNAIRAAEQLIHEAFRQLEERK